LRHSCMRMGQRIQRDGLSIKLPILIRKFNLSRREWITPRSGRLLAIGAEIHSCFYANGVAFQSPGSPRNAAHPGITKPQIIQTPTGFYNRTVCTNERPDIGFICVDAMPFPDLGMFRQSSCANVQPRWGSRGNWASVPQGARQSRDPGLWNLTPLAYPAIGVSCGWRIARF
jgi:hypothetical protein